MDLEPDDAITGNNRVLQVVVARVHTLNQAFFLTASLENGWAQKLRSIEFLSQNPRFFWENPFRGNILVFAKSVESFEFLLCFFVKRHFKSFTF